MKSGDDVKQTPPRADKKRLEKSLHGHVWVDDYAWLRDENWQEVMKDPSVLDPDIRAYLEAENSYTQDILSPYAQVQDKIFDELCGRIPQKDFSPPRPRDHFVYYSRFEEGGQHPLFCRKPWDRHGKTAGSLPKAQQDPSEEILLDGNAMSVSFAFFDIKKAQQSPDHSLFAYSYDDTGSEYCHLRIKDVTSAEELADDMHHTSGDFFWSNDNRYLFYVLLDAHHRPSKVMRHRLGEAQDQDVKIYEEADPGFFVSLDKCESGRFILISAHDHTTSEVHLVDADNPLLAPLLVAERQKDVIYTLTHDAARGRFFILTNDFGAEDFQIMTALENAPGKELWQIYKAHKQGSLIQEMMLLEHHLVRLVLEKSLPKIIITPLDQNLSAPAKEYSLDFEGAAYSLHLLSGMEYKGGVLRYAFSSPIVPQRIYDYDLTSKQSHLRKEQKIPSGHNPDDYNLERLWTKAEDGADIPLSVFYKKSTPLDGSAPVLLYGYGSYGMRLDAGFVPNRFSLVERGFIYVMAHIRGGKDMGYHWYTSGKGQSKKNTFTDFIDAARFLIQEGLTRKGEISIHGGSAGGMLVGAVVNMAPELFKACVAEVPFVDVLNTMSDPSLPLTPPEWPEWGNPIQNSADFAYIHSYSPYDNIKKQKYPHILATAGLSDPRVTYWEPAKWVAKLRAHSISQNLVLLYTHMQAGHGGKAGRFEKLRDVALVYTFLLFVYDKPE